MISLGFSLVLYSLVKSSLVSCSCGGISIEYIWIAGDLSASCWGASCAGIDGGSGLGVWGPDDDSGGGWKGRSGDVLGSLADIAGELTDASTGGKFRSGKSKSDISGLGSKSPDLCMTSSS